MNYREGIFEVIQGLATTTREGADVLDEAISGLSRLLPGTWVGVLVDNDMSTTRLLARDASAPEIEAWLTNVAAELHRGGGIATSDLTLSGAVLELNEPLMRNGVRIYDLLRAVLLGSPVAQAYVDSHPAPPPLMGAELNCTLVPMRGHGSTLGVLGVLAHSPNRLGDGDVAAVQAVADVAGRVIQGGHLSRSGARWRDRLEAFQKVCLALRSGADLGLTLRVILDQITANHKHVDAADVLLADERDGSLGVAAAVGFSSDQVLDIHFEKFPVTPGPGVYARPLEELFGGSRPLAMRRRTHFAREGFAVYRGMPLLIDGNLVGVIEAFGRGGWETDRDCKSFLENMAGLATVAIRLAGEARSQESTIRPGATSRSALEKPHLGDVEEEILRLLTAGRSNQAIAECVHLSPHTIRFHVRRLLKKAGAANRTELAWLAVTNGWVPGKAA